MTTFSPSGAVPISLDIETSGLDPHKHSILSVGIVNFYSGEYSSWDIRHSQDVLISPEAFRVNNIDTRILDDHVRVPLLEADIQLSEIIREAKLATSDIVLPMGLNVGSFDLKFLEVHMPLSAKAFGYRAIDLNTLIVAFAHRRKRLFVEMKKTLQESSNEHWKAAYPSLMGQFYKPHEALSDAFSNCYLYSVLMNEKPKWMGDY